MIFSDLFFLYVFLPLCVLLYFVAEGITAKNYILIIASLFFYAWGEPACVILLIVSAFVNYFCSLGILKYKGSKKAKAFLILALVYNLGALLVFKYTGFFIENVNGLFGLNIGIPKIVLPIGISFYTFKITSYIIDCYWEKVDVQTSFSKLFLYISLFPQLMAGPIVRYTTIGDELTERKSTLADISKGATRFIIGLAKR